MSDEPAEGVEVELPKAVERMPDDKLKEFVRGVVGGQIFTNYHINSEHAGAVLGMVFLPAGLGGLKGLDVKQIGCIWEYYSEAGPRSVNGYPSFMSMRVMHVEDWQRALPEIQRLEQALNNVELPPR